MLVVYRAIPSLRGGCTSVLMLYFNNPVLSRSTIYVILARHQRIPEDDVLMSKHVGANHMQLYVIKCINIVQSLVELYINSMIFR